MEIRATTALVLSNFNSHDSRATELFRLSDEADAVDVLACDADVGLLPRRLDRSTFYPVWRPQFQFAPARPDAFNGRA